MRKEFVLVPFLAATIAACHGGKPEPVTALAVTRIAMFQGSQALIMRDGSAEQSRVPVVAGREGLLRIYVTPRDEWEERAVRAVLTIDEGGEVREMEQELTVDDVSYDSELSSTFNFAFAPGEITQETRFRVDLYEVDRKTKWKGEVEDSAWPDEGTSLFKAETSGPVEVVIYPVRYRADGSNRLPDTSEEQVRAFYEVMYGMYPATDLTVTVHDPMDWWQAIEPYGNGWDTLLYQMMQIRYQANVDPNTYFYGLFQPAANIYDYCSQGCVLGMSTVGGPADVWSRASIGVGFPGNDSVDTMPHEIGHAHGREHAPCGLYGQPSDPGYPHDDAELGVWGYDVVNGTLKSPTTNADVMSYCSPQWVSDYTFEGFLERIHELESGDYDRSAGPTSRWLAWTLHEDGSLTPGRPFDLSTPPIQGEALAVDLVDEDGASIEGRDAWFYPFGTGRGGIVFFADPGFEVRAAALAP